MEEKIIERAQKKLYLDAAVIQQGRLAETSKALSKDLTLTLTLPLTRILTLPLPLPLTKALSKDEMLSMIPVSPLYLAYVSPISLLYLPYISPISP